MATQIKIADIKYVKINGKEASIANWKDKMFYKRSTRDIYTTKTRDVYTTKTRWVNDGTYSVKAWVWVMVTGISVTPNKPTIIVSTLDTNNCSVSSYSTCTVTGNWKGSGNGTKTFTISGSKSTAVEVYLQSTLSRVEVTTNTSRGTVKCTWAGSLTNKDAVANGGGWYYNVACNGSSSYGHNEKYQAKTGTETYKEKTGTEIYNGAA